MFSRVIGPLLVIATATAVGRTSDMRALLSEFGANFVWPWVTGAFVLVLGLVVVALHEYWRGAAALIVSVLGWLTVLKGLFLMAFPRTYISLAESMLDVTAWWWTAFIVMGLIGLYLTYVGWASGRRRHTFRATRSTANLPRAA
jgi:uncharacterized membrane protein